MHANRLCGLLLSSTAVLVVNADPYGALQSVFGDSFSNCEVWDKLPCASSLAYNAVSVDVPYFCDCIKKTLLDGKKIFDWILDHEKRCIVYNSDQTQYLENKCRGVHKPTQYRHVDSGCSNVVGYPVAHPITYAAPTASGGVITTSCRVSCAQGYTGLMPMDVYAVVNKEECQRACLKTRQTPGNSDDCLGYSYLENDITKEINGAKPGRCYLFNAPGRTQDCSLPNPDTLHLVTNSTLSFDALYDCVTQESPAESGGEVGYMANMMSPVPLISPLKAQLTPIPSCIILSFAAEKVARQRGKMAYKDLSKTSAQSCLKSCYEDNACKATQFDTVLFSTDNTKAIQCWKYEEVPTELQAEEAHVMHYNAYALSDRPDGSRKDCTDLEFSIQGVGQNGSCYLWFKVEREIEMSEGDDQWAGAPGTEMAGKMVDSVDACMALCSSAETCFGFDFNTDTSYCKLYALGAEGIIYRKADHVYYVKRVVDNCEM